MFKKSPTLILGHGRDLYLFLRAHSLCPKSAWRWTYRVTEIHRYHSCNYRRSAVITLIFLREAAGVQCQFLQSAWQCPQFTHIITLMREERNSKKKKEAPQRALWRFTEHTICFQSFDGLHPDAFLKAIKRLLWTSKPWRGHVEMHMIYCLAWGIIFVRFHCVAGNKHAVNLCEPHCHISQIVHFPLSKIKAWLL